MGLSETPSNDPSLANWIYVSAGLAALSGLLFIAVPTQFGGVVAICQQVASRLMTLPDDFEQQAIVGLLFFAATCWQWMFTALLIAYRSQPRRHLIWAGLLWNGGVLGLWIAARLASLLSTNFPAQPVAGAEFLARCVEVALMACLLVLLREAPRPSTLAARAG